MWKITGRFVFFLFVIFIIVLFIDSMVAEAKTKNTLKVEPFAGDDGMLQEREIISYLLVLLKPSYGKIWSRNVSQEDIAAANGDILLAKEKDAHLNYLEEMRKELSADPPYTIAQFEYYLKYIDKEISEEKKETKKKEEEEKEEEKDDWEIEKPQLRFDYFDWGKEKTKKGVEISYSENWLKKTNTWITQGSIILPIRNNNFKLAGVSDFQMAFLPNIYWNYQKTNMEDKDDIEEVAFRLPFWVAIDHYPKFKWLKKWKDEFYLTPFYSTDFDLNGEIVGGHLAYIPSLNINNKFQINRWYGIIKSKPIAYHLKIAPGINYSQVISEGDYINREKKEEILGPTLALQLGIKPFGEDSSWKLQFGYDFLYDMDEEHDEFLERWEASLDYWFQESTGAILKYEKGDMFLTNQAVDQLKLSLLFYY